MARIWLVEMRINGVWEPTVGAYLTRSDARKYLVEDWLIANPTDIFRVRQYVRKVSA